jgi:dihydropteroate synthase
MGILNVTPDSFSDGGRFTDPDAALAHGLGMVEAGADIIDVGGESTRPGAASVPAAEEARRVLPVIASLAGRSGAVLSVDTTKASVARAALEAGAHIVNDVSALTFDPDMVHVARESNGGVVLMHMRGSPLTMQADPHYADVVAEVAAMLRERVAAAVAAGIDRRRLAVDPGIGFGKTVAHNVRLLRRLDALAGLGLPVLVGLSRKSFLGALTGRDVPGRTAASVAGMLMAVLNGAHIVRVHDVEATVDALRVAEALRARDANGSQEA